MKRLVMVLGVASVIFVSGCAELEKVKDELTGGRTSDYPSVSNTVKQGCLGGFAAGVVTNLVKRQLIEDKKFNAGKLLRDGVIGAIIGCTIAEGLNKRRENFASDADHFDAEILDAQFQNDETKKLVAHTRSLTQESRGVLEQLKADKARKKLAREEVAIASSNAAADLRWAKNELKVVESNLEQRQTASALMEQKGDSERVQLMSTEIKELQSYVSTLEREVASLASINDAIGQLDA